MRAMPIRVICLLAVVTLPGPALAVGDEDDTAPPPSTQTTTTCEDGHIWDEATETCVPPEASGNDAATLMQTARELAYAERYTDAARVLDLLPPQDAWVLTYRGFLARKTGDLDAAKRYYSDALNRDPDHLLARAYMGLGLIAAGDTDAARFQLAEIRRRGGAGSWPEHALSTALHGGASYDY